MKYFIVMLGTLLILLTNCKSIILSQMNKQNSIETMIATDLEIKKYDTLPSVDDSIIKIIKLDSINFVKLVNDRLEEFNTLLIHFWATFNEETYQNIDSNLLMLTKNYGKKIILVSFDISSRKQIELIKKFLNLKGFTGTFYIIELSGTSILDVIDDIQNLKSYRSIILSIDKNPSKEGLSNTYIIDKSKNIKYKTSGIIDPVKINILIKKED
jgi:hypothetical protein